MSKTVAILIVTSLAILLFAINWGTASNTKQNIEMAKLGFQQCKEGITILWKKECSASAE